MFLDDWEYDLFVCVISFDNFRTTTEIPSQYNVTWDVCRYSPLEISGSLILLLTAPTTNETQDHPSESPVPLSSLLRGSKNEERSQSARHRNPPPKLNPKPRIPPTSSPNPTRDLIDPPEIRVNDLPSGPSYRPSGDLRNQVTDGDHGGQAERDEAQHDEADE